MNPITLYSNIEKTLTNLNIKIEGLEDRGITGRRYELSANTNWEVLCNLVETWPFATPGHNSDGTCWILINLNKQ